MTMTMIEKPRLKPGPKPRTPDKLRGEFATIILTPPERVELYEFASQMGISVSEVLRRGMELYMQSEGASKKHHEDEDN